MFDFKLNISATTHNRATARVIAEIKLGNKDRRTSTSEWCWHFARVFCEGFPGQSTMLARQIMDGGRFGNGHGTVQLVTLREKIGESFFEAFRAGVFDVKNLQ